MVLARRFVLSGVAVALAGCGAKPIILDREAMQGIKRIAVPTVGAPDTPSVEVVNSVSRQLGLIGLIAGETVSSNRRSALKAMLVAHSLDPQATLQADIAARLQARNIMVMAQAADPSRRAFLAAYPPSSERDAVLDVILMRYGYVALSDADRDPYRPTVALSVRLVSARDASVLMQDGVYISGFDGPVLSPTGQDLGASTFPTFTEIEANPARAVVALRLALAAAADGIAKRLA